MENDSISVLYVKKNSDGLILWFAALRTAGKLPKHNNVSWRGNSCLEDGKGESGTFYKDLKGGFYDAGDAIKFNFPKSFAMTMLSWSVIEYSAKYEAAGELNHVKDIIKWGADYFLKTFNSTADSINSLVMQVHTMLIMFSLPYSCTFYFLRIPDSQLRSMSTSSRSCTCTSFPVYRGDC